MAQKGGSVLRKFKITRKSIFQSFFNHFLNIEKKPGKKAISLVFRTEKRAVTAPYSGFP
ncbi:hypothetical protein AB434_3416 [Heyndrickxia coagulans]|uniref:Uncharacterized protein n=1 Tax=Heyndrickxia coagulans TaxID=1398 RepID=A0A0C5CMW9_HEYCO|nr:hypothetical protein SB48_HM08orf02940 [Heyndrickxia coagulans]AKN55821.1 hypothetical protein AB434_3416 [Heyndrickxia coagulans]KWZ79592.1 hypothetical protein HMPREF3213_02696 [Heyndrickxia coagulans]KYC64088.1 hypothetical protein B4100_3222 [Heyndrickxia coagulans]